MRVSQNMPFKGKRNAMNDDVITPILCCLYFLLLLYTADHNFKVFYQMVVTGQGLLLVFFSLNICRHISDVVYHGFAETRLHLHMSRHAIIYIYIYVCSIWVIHTCRENM